MIAVGEVNGSVLVIVSWDPVQGYRNASMYRYGFRIVRMHGILRDGCLETA